MVATVWAPGWKRPCTSRTYAWISGADPRFAVLTWQVVCGGSLFNHSWLRRSDKNAKRWVVVGDTAGTNVQKAPCIRIRSVPADLECR